MNSEIVVAFLQRTGQEFQSFFFCSVMKEMRFHNLFSFVISIFLFMTLAGELIGRGEMGA